jgi:thymidylate synthase
MRNKFERDYQKILHAILNTGVQRDSRTGTTIAVFNRQLCIDLNEGFPIITGRRMFYRTIKAEFEWMMTGSTNIQYLKDRGIGIWDQWADINGEVGPMYGHQIMKQWEEIKEGIRINPHGRRHVINLWNIAELTKMVLPPCYYNLQFIVQDDTLSMTVDFRSSDAAVGLPYDTAVLTLILMRMAEQAGLAPWQLVLRLTDAHINIENLEAVEQYLQRRVWPLPKLPDLKCLKLDDYICETHIPMIVKP